MVKGAKQEKVLQEIREKLERISPANPNHYYPFTNLEQCYWHLYKAGKYYVAVGVYRDLAGIDLIFRNDDILYSYDYDYYRYDYKEFILYHKNGKVYKSKMEFIETILCDYDNMQQFEIPEDYRY